MTPPNIKVQFVRPDLGMNFSNLEESEWIFFDDHFINPDTSNIYIHSTTQKKRYIPIKGIYGEIVSCLCIEGEHKYTRPDDKIKALLLGAAKPACSAAPPPLPPGIYFVDNFIFFVRGDIEQASVFFVVPLETMQFFNAALSGINSYKVPNIGKYRYLRASNKRPLHKALLTDILGISLEALQFINYLTLNYNAAFVTSSDILKMKDNRNKLFIILGRNEDWMSGSMDCMSQALQNGSKIFCAASETMYGTTVPTKNHLFLRDRRKMIPPNNGLIKNEIRDVIGCNLIDGGYYGAEERNTQHIEFVVHDASGLLSGTDLRQGDKIILPPEAYDGLPFRAHSSPPINFDMLSTWAEVKVFAYHLKLSGRFSPSTGVIATFKNRSGGQCVQLGTLNWTSASVWRDEHKKSIAMTLIKNSFEALQYDTPFCPVSAWGKRGA